MVRAPVVTADTNILISALEGFCLLRLGTFEGCLIMTLGDFLDRYTSRPDASRAP